MKSLSGNHTLWGDEHILGDLTVDGTVSFAGGGTGVITSINADTTPAQLIVAGTKATVSTAGGTTTIGVVSTSTPGAGSIPQWDTNVNLKSVAFIPSLKAPTTETLTLGTEEILYKNANTNSTITLPSTVSGAVPLGRQYRISSAYVNATGTLTIVSGTTTLFTISGNGSITAPRNGSPVCEYLIFCVDNSAGATDLSSWAWYQRALNSQDLASYATTTGAFTCVYNSPRNLRLTGSTARTFTLPAVATIVIGTVFLMSNSSTANLTINSGGAALVATVVPGTSCRVRSISISDDTAAGWMVI